MGQGIQEVRFRRSGPGRYGVEQITLARLRENVGLAEFHHPQRPLFHHLLRVATGTATVAVDFTRHVVAAGDLLWMRPGQVVQFFGFDRIDGSSTLIDPSVLDRRLIGVQVDSGPTVRPAADVDDLLNRIGDLPRLRSDVGRAVTAAALGNALLAALSDARDDPAPTLFQRYRSLLDVDFRRERDVTRYARRLDVSARTLTRGTRAATGRSAKEVCDDRVVLEAKRLLASTTRTAADIGFELGFSEPTHFSRFFRSRTGLTTGEFRRAVAADSVGTAC